jgi:hypothetical protein
VKRRGEAGADGYPSSALLDEVYSSDPGGKQFSKKSSDQFFAAVWGPVRQSSP